MVHLCMKVLFVVFICRSITAKKNCFWNAECPYKYFSSKTPYNSVRGDIRDSIVKLKACEPISVWSLIRHGKRSPGKIFGQKMREAMVVRDYVAESYKKENSSICAQDIENLLNWQPDNDLFDNIHCLTNEGHQEMFGIGRRIKEAFGKLLENLADGSYSIRSAPGHWVEDGVSGFVKGLSKKPLHVESSIPHYDIMAPYESCSKYVMEVKRSPDIYNEAHKYQESAEYLATKERIQKRTGIQYNLSNANITSLYDLCRYTWSGIDNKASPWCALFTKEDLQVIEYCGDLRHYYRNGPGTPINKIFGRIPLADMYRIFESAKNDSNRKITVYFTHATMMDMTYTALGWYTDEVPLTSVHRNPNRKWNSTKLGVFAGNIIAVLYRCEEDNKEDYKVIFYQNEEPVTSICDAGVCSWQEFENTFKPFLNTSLDFCST